MKALQVLTTILITKEVHFGLIYKQTNNYKWTNKTPNHRQFKAVIFTVISFTSYKVRGKICLGHGLQNMFKPHLRVTDKETFNLSRICNLENQTPVCSFKGTVY